jgi:hypothetical protein
MPRKSLFPRKLNVTDEGKLLKLIAPRHRIYYRITGQSGRHDDLGTCLTRLAQQMASRDEKTAVCVLRTCITRHYHPCSCCDCQALHRTACEQRDTRVVARLRNTIDKSTITTYDEHDGSKHQLASLDWSTMDVVHVLAYDSE